jgi:hypothetical protein
MSAVASRNADTEAALRNARAEAIRFLKQVAQKQGVTLRVGEDEVAAALEEITCEFNIEFANFAANPRKKKPRKELEASAAIETLMLHIDGVVEAMADPRLPRSVRPSCDRLRRSRLIRELQGLRELANRVHNYRNQPSKRGTPKQHGARDAALRYLSELYVEVLGLDESPGSLPHSSSSNFVVFAAMVLAPLWPTLSTLRGRDALAKSWERLKSHDPVQQVSRAKSKPKKRHRRGN